MRKLILMISTSLDGFVCGLNGESEWMFKSMTPEGAAWRAEFTAQAGAHLLGRKSFESMATFWPSSTHVAANAMNEIPKIVFSKKGYDLSSLPESAKNWAEAKVVTGDLAEGIKELKKTDGKFLLAHGGAEFAQSLVQTGLVDEYWLVIHPVAIGQGKSLFAGIKTPMFLKYVETKVFSSGALVQVYHSQQ
jgi:dihydrofolate reductase